MSLNTNNNKLLAAFAKNNNNNTNIITDNMNKIKRLHELKSNEKLNDKEMKEIMNIANESIIKPTVQTKMNDTEFKTTLNNLNNQYTKQEINKMYSNRTNSPYKCVLRDVVKNIDYNKKIENIDDLVIYKISDVDKLIKLLEDDTQRLLDEIEHQNKDMSILYSNDKKLQHKKKFDYSHLELINSVYNPSEHSDMKDNISMYKKQQQLLEINKKRGDDIINNLIESGIVTKEDLNELMPEISNNNNNNCNSKSVAKLINNENRPIVAKLINNNENKPIVAKLINNDNGNTDKNIDVKISDDIKNKYKQRQIN